MVLPLPTRASTGAGTRAVWEGLVRGEGPDRYADDLSFFPERKKRKLVSLLMVVRVVFKDHRHLRYLGLL